MFVKASILHHYTLIFTLYSLSAFFFQWLSEPICTFVGDIYAMHDILRAISTFPFFLIYLEKDKCNKLCF